MYVAIQRKDRTIWNGEFWVRDPKQARTFLTEASLLRSLNEEGEDPEKCELETI
jgi:hypothetical protein